MKIFLFWIKGTEKPKKLKKKSLNIKKTASKMIIFEVFQKNKNISHNFEEIVEEDIA